MDCWVGMMSWNKQDLPSYYKYWGKAKRDPKQPGPEYHLLVYHSLDVAAVGWVLLDPEKPLCQSLARQLGIEPEWLRDWFVFCLRLHDIGKFFRAFQNLAPNLSEALVSYVGQCIYAKRHDTLGFMLWQKKLKNLFGDVLPPRQLDLMDPWLEIACGHHGQPPENVREISSFLLENDEQAAEIFVKEIRALWPLDLTPLAAIDKKTFRRVSWQLAGVAVLADWLGSNQSVFRYMTNPMSLNTYWETIALPRACQAVEVADIGQRAVNPFTSISQQFEFIADETATPLQRHAQTVTLGEAGQLFILEDVTGAGKTEAAMVLVHRLMAAGLANGVYVGLPTMATANAMYERMAVSYRNLYALSERPSLVLSHSARQLSDAFTESVRISEQAPDRDYDKGDLPASAYCNQWLADSRKKALLADVGVGTIDQALLGVLPARHQSLRMLGLAGKVLLVDEVHAFDPYMRQLLAALLQAHAAQGGSAILLSATLPYAFRCDLVRAFAVGAKCEAMLPENKNDYPLVTHLSGAGLEEHKVETRASVRRSVQFRRLGSEEDAMVVIQEAVARGRCVCWIRNTVNDARSAYLRLIDEKWMEPVKLTLFHSRYAMVDRQRIEQDVLQRFGKKSAHQQRSGQVLIATQVVEQSLDLDFDVMISDVAPIDLLIQRAGRLQRHLRKANGDLVEVGATRDERPKPCLCVLAPDPADVQDSNWLKAILPGTQAVYPNIGQLWLTLRTLESNAGFAMPEDARTLIEGVYSQDVQEAIPDALQQASNNALADQRAQSGMGEFNCLKLEKGYTRSSADHSGGWDEEVRIPTRLGDDAITVTLARYSGDRLLPYAADPNSKNAWALSQISLPSAEWVRVSQRIPAALSQSIEELKRTTAALKWVEILPLTADTQDFYDSDGGWQPVKN